MNILLIGGTGILSGAVTSEALKKGINVTMINRGNRIIPDGVELIKADMNDLSLISSKLRNRHFDAIADFLCYTPEQSKRSYVFYSQYADQYFYISSMAVYDKSIPGPLTEDHAKGMKIWKYSTDKWASELLIKELSLGNKCKVTVVRPGVTYDNTRIPLDIYPRYGYHWLYAARLLAKKPNILCDGGSHFVKPLRVEDFAIGFVGLIGNPKAYDEAFNICADCSCTYQDVMDVIGGYLGIEIKTIEIPSQWYARQIPHRSGELLAGRCTAPLCSLNEGKLANQKIKSVVPEFRQRIGWKEGIQMTLDAYKSQNFQKGIDWTFDADTDRIIKKWCKQKGVDWKQYHLGFVDYLGNATFTDKFNYFLKFYGDIFIVKLISKIISLINR